MRSKISNLTHIFVVLAVLGLSSTVQAKRIFSSGDWSLYVTGNLCTARTRLASYDGMYSFIVVADRTGELPMQVMVYPDRQPTKKQGFKFKLDGDTYLFAKLPGEDNGTLYEGNTFWNIPLNTKKLISYIKRYNRIRIMELSGKVGHPFSLKGSSATINKLIDVCGSESLLAAEEFESMFLNASNTNVELQDIDPMTAAEMREVLAEGVADYKEWFMVRGELDGLEAHYADLTSELETLETSINHIQYENIPYFNSEKVSAENKIATAKTEKTQYLAMISQETPKLRIAEQNYQQAKNNIAPYVYKHDTLLNKVRNANANLSNLNSKISQVTSDISNKEYQLSRMHVRADQIQYRVQDLRRERRQLNNRLAMARQKLNNFNPEQVFKNRRFNNQELAQIRQRVPMLKQRIQNHQVIVEQAKRKLNGAQNRLEQCQANKSVQPGPKKKGPGHNNGGDTKGPQCAEQRMAVRNARQELQQARAAHENLVSTFENLEQRRLSIRQQIRNNVQADHNELRRNVNHLERRVSTLANEIQNLDQEKSNIVIYRIPTAEREIRQLYSELNQLKNEQFTVQQEVVLARQNYNSYKQSVNYDYLKSETVRTRGVVDQIQRRINDYQAEVARRDRVVREQTEYKDSMIAAISNAHSTLASQKQRKVEVEELLVPYSQEKAVIVSKLNLKRQKLAKTSDEYTQLVH